MLPALALLGAASVIPGRARAQGTAPGGAPAQQGPPGAAVRGPDGGAKSQGTTSETIDRLKGDLRRLVGANEVYRAKNGRFSSSVDALTGYRPSSGVTVTMLTASATGWAAEARAQALPGKSCVIFIGAVPKAPTTAAERRSAGEAVVACDRP